MTTTPTATNIDKAIAILRGTRDGDTLAPEHLYLVQCAANGRLSDLGQVALDELHASVTAGTYVRPWLHDVEHLTKNHDGFVFWKGREVDHFSFRDDVEGEREAAREIGRRCRILEARGVEVNTTTVVWKWTETETETGTDGRTP